MSEVRRFVFARKLIFVLVITLPILALLAAAGFWFIMDSPYGGDEDKTVELVIPKGMSFREVAQSLEESGLAANSQYLEWRYRIASKMGIARAHQAGRYALKSGQKPSELIAILTSSKGAQRIYTTLTVPPGSTSSRIAALVEEAGLARSEDVKSSIKILASEYPIIQTQEGLQGYLFPDTYKIETPLEVDAQTSRFTANTIVRMMADRFFQILDETDASWRKLTRPQLHEKVILASIVEREYRVEEEAPLISAVFHNRLEKNMALQSCATVVYTIEETEVGKPFRNDYLRFNRRIFEQYLEIASEYNTYHHAELPPGPIASPGSRALEASFYPAESDALYFVVKNPVAGTHVFTRNYSDHLDARADYLNWYVVKD